MRSYRGKKKKKKMGAKSGCDWRPCGQVGGISIDVMKKSKDLLGGRQR